ncbi:MULTISPECIES: HAMP domain-containing sensor histidine kinase [Kitasatospora]|uniref:sensor histidine kinase n=1 Tax=Kitasatospora TaxID=2063 RepID=UPI0005250180|nr:MULTISPECIES: HAMP domain-containing sensor histidine kinase [Kitasatospora]
MRWAMVKAAIAGTVMVALAFLIPLGLMVQQTARDRAFTAAERQAAALGPALAITTDQQAVAKAMASTDAGTRERLAVHLPGGITVGPARTDNDQPPPSTDPQGVTPTVHSGTARVAGGYVLLQPVAVDRGGIAMVEVFIPNADLSRGVGTAWLVLSGVALALVAVSVAVADRMGTRIIRSARRLATAARSLGSGNLSVRVPVEGREAAGAPEELREAAYAFNAMADRVVHLLAAERELAADLSHRLRTPLTVLRLNAAALGHGDAADATRHAVSQLEREVDQIIRTARRQPEDAPPVALGCDAVEVLRDRVAFWSALAEDEGRPWRLAGDEAPAPVPVQRGDLAAAVDALLGNVFRHTAVGTAFAVDLVATEGAVVLLVGDAGPGFTDPAQAIRRGAGHGGEGSTGLGLDIVRKLAEGTGGEVLLGRSAVLGGAEITVRINIRTEVELPKQQRRRTSRPARRD